jgi:hypothetical protein
MEGELTFYFAVFSNYKAFVLNETLENTDSFDPYFFSLKSLSLLSIFYFNETTGLVRVVLKKCGKTGTLYSSFAGSGLRVRISNLSSSSN